MRITYLLPRPELGGGNKVIFHHAHLLADLGHEVTVVGDGPAPDWFRLRVPYRDHGAGRLRHPDQDLVIATFWTTLGKAEELGLGPLAHFCQGYEGDLAHLQARLPEIEAAYSRPLPTLVVSPHLRGLLGERFGRRTRVVPPALDPALRPARGRRHRRAAARRPWVAVPGIFEAPVKGVDVALEAVSDLRRGGLPVRVLRFSTLPQSDREREVLAAETYLCRVDPEIVAGQVARCDLLLLPSREGEGFGLPALEAMAQGVPVVASAIPPVRAFAGGAAALVPAGDAGALAAAARELLTEPARWRAARDAGLGAAEAFRPSRMAAALEAGVRWAAQVAAEPSTAKRPS